MKFTLKKENNYNFVVIRFYYLTIWLILSNNTLLSLLSALIYYLFLPDYILNISDLIHLLLGIGFFLLHCWNTPANYCIVEKRASPLSQSLSYYSFNIYLLTSNLLGSKLLWLDSVCDLSFFLKSYNNEPITESFYSQLQPWSVACMMRKKHF